MKLKNLFLAALAGSMVFASCTSEETVPMDKRLKSVKVTLPNINSDATRATGPGVTASTAILNDYKIFFFDAQGKKIDVPYTDGNATKVVTSTEQGAYEQETYFNTSVTNAEKSVTFHFLPSSVTQVAVVGNLGIEANYDFITNLSDILGKSFEMQNDGVTTTGLNNNQSTTNPYYPLFGIDTELEGTPPASHTYGTYNPIHNNVFSATVNLKPAVARLEVLGFGYSYSNEENGPKYTKVTLDKICLKNYYTSFKFNNVSNNVVNPTYVGNVVNPVVTQENAFNVINSCQAPWADKLPTAGSDAAVVLETATGATVYKYANNSELTSAIATNSELSGATLDNLVTYSIVNNTKPELLINLKGESTGVAAVPHYLWANKFKNASGEVTFEAGNVYRTVISFKDTDLLDPQKCIELTVTVSPWVVEVVTPEFNK